MKMQTVSLVLAALLVSPVLAQAQETSSNKVPVNHMEPQYGSAPHMDAMTKVTTGETMIVAPESSDPTKPVHHITPH